MTDQRTITYLCEVDSLRNNYVFETIFWIAGIRARKATAGDSVDLYYGNRQDQPCRLQIPEKLFPLDPKTVLDQLEDPVPTSDEQKPLVLSTDFIHTIGSLLTDEVHDGAQSDHFDKHHRLHYAASFQSKMKNPLVPVVNAYILYLKDILVNLFGVKPLPLWPDNNRAAFLLSHDVDEPDKYSFIKHYKVFPPRNSGRGLLSYNYYIFRNYLNYLKDPNKEENWLFREIMEAEGKYNFKSSFYFASKPFFAADAHAVDVPYDISKKRFQPVFEQMKSNGFEIGLHASYNAYQDPKYFKAEKERLERIAQCEVVGLRHHFWHLAEKPFQTMHYHELAGFKYDSSLSFNYHPGYRFNSAFPFYPFDRQRNKRINVMQLPAFYMDGNTFYRENATVKEAMDEASPYIESIIQQQGIGSIDWHVRTSYPSTNEFKRWGEGYLAILEHLHAQENIWVTSGQEIYAWLEQRSQKLLSNG